MLQKMLQNVLQIVRILNPKTLSKPFVARDLECALFVTNCVAKCYKMQI